MSQRTIEANFECPHCGAGYSFGEDAIYTDDVEDECAEKCDSCGGWFQVTCEHVEVELNTVKAPEAIIAQMKERRR